MATSLIYSITISNSYLGKTKVVKGATKQEARIKAEQQLEIWNRQEAAQRKRASAQAEKEAKLKMINDLKIKTEQLNYENSIRINNYNEILTSAISNTNFNISWSDKKKIFSYDDFSYPDFSFTQKYPVKPELDTFMFNMRVPKKSFLESILKSKAVMREQKEAEAKSAYNEACAKYQNEVSKYNENKKIAEAKYNSNKAEALSEYNEKRSATEKEVSDYNESIDKLKNDYEAGLYSAVSQVIEECLNNSTYPSDFENEYQVSYDSNEHIAVISLYIPNIDSFSKIKEYKFVTSTKTIKEIEFKQKEFDNIYDNIVKQIALRTLYETFKYDYPNNIHSAVFNGWVKGIDKATGQEFNACILSVKMNRTDFESINFAQIDVTACIRNLKGLLAGNLAMLAPVKPIMEINTDDSRFIASREVLENLESGDNLATMDWEDFEHLVRELFSKYFSADGQQVQVTQSSRDGGVDAIAFDPDPIRGGKFVIQAKRYNKVVPVSAVRDLYGTMINEGAAKGILVTTSYFGNDSREFVKDKPISLIDGSNLIHMFSEFGYDVHIELQK